MLVLAAPAQAEYFTTGGVHVWGARARYLAQYQLERNTTFEMLQGRDNYEPGNPMPDLDTWLIEDFEEATLLHGLTYDMFLDDGQRMTPLPSPDTGILGNTYNPWHGERAISSDDASTYSGAPKRTLRFNLPVPACAVGANFYFWSAQHQVAINGVVVGSVLQLREGNTFYNYYHMFFLDDDGLASLGPIRSLTIVADPATSGSHGNLDYLAFRPCTAATLSAYGHLSGPSGTQAALAPPPTSAVSLPEGATPPPPPPPPLVRLEQGLAESSEELKEEGGCQPPARLTVQGLCLVEVQCDNTSQLIDGACESPSGSRQRPSCPKHFVQGRDAGQPFCWASVEGQEDEGSVDKAARIAEYAVAVISVLGGVIAVAALFIAVKRRELRAHLCGGGGAGQAEDKEAEIADGADAHAAYGFDGDGVQQAGKSVPRGSAITVTSMLSDGVAADDFEEPAEQGLATRSVSADKVYVDVQ